MKTIGIVQARMGSTRLYGKILYPIKRMPLLHVLAKRLENSKVDEWWLATTTQDEDKLTVCWGYALGWNVYRGSVLDVLSRFTAIIRKQNPYYVVRITADDPFTDGEVINLMLEQISSMNSDQKIMTAGSSTKLPLGYAPSIFVAESLLDIEKQIPSDQQYHKTHVTSWLKTYAKFKEFVPPANWPARPNWRWTVDTKDDALMISDAFDLFGDKWATISYPEIVSILDEHPDITGINAHIKQKKLEEG